MADAAGPSPCGGTLHTSAKVLLLRATQSNALRVRDGACLALADSTAEYTLRRAIAANDSGQTERDSWLTFSTCPRDDSGQTDAQQRTLACYLGQLLAVAMTTFAEFFWAVYPAAAFARLAACQLVWSVAENRTQHNDASRSGVLDAT